MLDNGSSAVSKYLELASAGTAGPAVEHVLKLLRNGTTIEAVIKSILAPAQERVGELWRANTWTWVQEHAVTSVTDAVLGALRLEHPTVEQPRGFLVTACVEGDFHSTPARMGSELLRLDGWDVVFAGASMPAHDLQKFVARSEPDAVVLGCSMTQLLPSARRCIEAISTVGAPVAVGGRGFGVTSHRSRRLGADAWIGDHEDLSAAVSAAPRRGGAPVESVPAAFQLELAIPALVDASENAMFSQMPGLRNNSESERERTRANVEYILHHVAIAIDVDDPEVIGELLIWLTDLLMCRHVGIGEIRQSLAIMCNVLSEAGLAEPATWLSQACVRLESAM
jgi:methanogenic corrinoid protein MtbC1